MTIPCPRKIYNNNNKKLDSPHLRTKGFTNREKEGKLDL